MTATFTTPASTAGLIGLGRMGAPIGRRLLAQGVPLIVHNRTRSKAETLLALGARWAESPRAVGEAASGRVIFTLLTDARAVRAVLLGTHGVAAGAGPGTLVVDLSTIAPDESRAIAARLAAKGLGFVDAPLGGSTPAAEEGRLLVYVGGSEPDVERARPLLMCFARRVAVLGPVGSGTSMKLVNNLLTVGHVTLAAEALALAAGLGIVRDTAIDLLLDGGGQSRMLADKRSEFSRREYPTRFSLALATKDLGLVARTARSVGGSVPIARELRRRNLEAIRAGWGEHDLSAVFERALARFGVDARSGAAPPAPPT
jgi:3-hydroxyisobutyrate dehydrogenase-like beta-hydroxyacid dehydrogenase